MATTLTTPLCVVINRTQLVLQQDDLTALSVDAVVFYASENLELGSGFGGAIQSRGGGAIKKELDKIGGIRMGEAVVTTGGQLHCRHVIHACGPKFLEEDTEPKLRACVLAALEAAEQRGLETIAFPPMGAGFYGFPLPLCAKVMLDTIGQYLQGVTALREVIICVIDRREFEAFKSKMQAL